MSKRKHADASLTCSLVRGVGYELIWSVDDVSRVLHSRVPGAARASNSGGLPCWWASTLHIFCREHCDLPDAMAPARCALQ